MHHRQFVQCRLAAAVAVIDGDPEVGRVVKCQGRRGDAEPGTAGDATDPLDDVVDVEDEIAVPIVSGNIADVEADSIDRVVVP